MVKRFCIHIWMTQRVKTLNVVHHILDFDQIALLVKMLLLKWPSFNSCQQACQVLPVSCNLGSFRSVANNFQHQVLYIAIIWLKHKLVVTRIWTEPRISTRRSTTSCQLLAPNTTLVSGDLDPVSFIRFLWKTTLSQVVSWSVLIPTHQMLVVL